MLKLTEFLSACGVQINLNNYKVHLATGYPNPPIEAYYKGTFKEWQEWQTRKNFQSDMVIGLIELRRNKWLFAGVYKVLGWEKKSERHIAYKTELLSGQDDLVGRVIVHHERRGRASYLIGKKDGGDFYISELREMKLTIEEFPGFNAINLSYSKIKIIISQSIQSWYSALSNIKGIYLISDNKFGKLYVGSAIGNSGIWQRWSDYAFNGHGGNKDLKAVLEENGQDHLQHFQYSILEIADFRLSDEDILRRESYWKDILCTRQFGYNSN